MIKRLNIGIIGAGRIGKVHAESLAFRIPEAHPAVIADVSEQAARDAAERFGIPKVAATATRFWRIPRLTRF
ncbi:MAG: Gfo/Idh/MocA family oxidoreductase [Paludibaculum sp.]